MKIFLLNGPPRAGKDLTGRLLAQMLPGKTSIAKFANPLKLAVHSVLTILSKGDKVRPPDHYENDKDEPTEDFFGAKPRDAYIAMSEDFCKPLFGKRIFGRVLATQLAHLKATEGVDSVVITDCGFLEEVEALISELPDEDYYVLAISREGCDFEKDSRSSIRLPTAPHRHHFIHNPGSLGGLRVAVAEFLTTVEE